MAWAFSALALPIIAFYLIKVRLEQKPISTLLFWRDLRPQVYNHSLWRRLRRWLSLALQLLFLLLLVAALSQPFWGGGTLKPRSLILVLDRSASMNATDVPPSRWAEAVRVARLRIAQMRFFDEAAVILAGETPEILGGWSRQKKPLQQALEGVAASHRPADIGAALSLARQLAAGRDNAEILLMSDGVWAMPPEGDALAGIASHWIGATPRNTGLTLFSARRSHAVPGEYQLVAQAVASYAVSGTVEILRDGQLMDVRPVTLKPGQTWRQTWQQSGTAAAQFTARFTGGERDDLALDNEAATGVDAVTPFPVELVAPPHPFLEAVLKALGTVTYRRTWPADGISDANRFYIFYKALPPEGFRPRAMLIIDPNGDGFWGKVQGEMENVLVSDVEKKEPILRFLTLEELRLHKARELAPPPGATVYAGSFGKPLLFGKWEGDHRWLVLPFGLEDSDLVFRTTFPILLGNLVQTLQPDGAKDAPALPGEVVTKLQRTAPEVAPAPAAAAPTAWWSAWPLWWWALFLGVVWLLAEWWLFGRRITE